MDRQWLARTPEAAIEPELEICDPHHHLWSVPTGRYPRYELEDLREDTGAGHNVVETVFIDCGANYRSTGPEALRPVGETEFVAERAARSEATPGARIAAIVGHADLLLGDAVREVLDAHLDAAGGRFRGIRHTAAWDPSPEIPTSHSSPPPHLYADERFRRGLAVLAGMGLTFEAWQFHPQLGELADVAAAVPQATIIVNHIGAPMGIGPYAGRHDEVRARWRPAMARLATLDNVVLKVGGIGMARFGAGFDAWEHPPSSDELLDHWGDDLRFCIDTFGPQRCMFESNYPVDAESASYVVLWNAYKKLSAVYDEAERTALFRGTARRVYRIG
ncbi:MAG: amidohydrolase [Acidimicrobiales bacterium]|nr:amidohydrolase [Acidimicrobiales bacterium]